MTFQEALVELNHMGKAWFISRYYHEFINADEDNYTKANQLPREQRFKKTTEFYAELLIEVLASPEKKLSNNQLGLTGKEVHDLTKVCLLKLLGK